MATSQKRTSKKLESPLVRARRELDDILMRYRGAEFVLTDPIQIPHQFVETNDREVTALLAALFSFGNVRSILATLRKLLAPLGSNPATALREISPNELKQLTKELYYRFFSAEDIYWLLSRLKEVLTTTSIGSFFESEWTDEPIENLARIRRQLLSGSRVSPGLKFMIPDPERGAAKRLHMFMRWMVRKDEIDLGLWQFARPSQLIVPLDTHVYEICHHLRLTRLKSPSLKAALEITDVLKSWDPEDPLKYDFAICRVGVLRLKKAFLSDCSR